MIRNYVALVVMLCVLAGFLGVCIVSNFLYESILRGRARMFFMKVERVGYFLSLVNLTVLLIYCMLTRI